MCLKTKSVDRKKSVTTASGIQLYQIYQLRFIGSSMRLSYYFQKKIKEALKITLLISNIFGQVIDACAVTIYCLVHGSNCLSNLSKFVF